MLIIIDHTSVILFPCSINIPFFLHVQKLVEELGGRLVAHYLSCLWICILFNFNFFAEEKGRNFVNPVVLFLSLRQGSLIPSWSLEWTLTLVDFHRLSLLVEDSLLLRLWVLDSLDCILNSGQENFIKFSQISFIADLVLVTRIIHNRVQDRTWLNVRLVSNSD